MATITVLTAVHKSEKPEYLRQALKSIWEDQTRKPDEIILVEDGPLGRELHRVIADFKSRTKGRFKSIVNEENLGLTKSLNKGLSLASGELIARMDSDDISLPDRFARQVEYMERHPSVAVLGSFIREFNDIEGDLGIRSYPIENEEIKRYIHKASPVAHPSVMLRGNVFRESLHYDERYITSQDVALWFEVLHRGYLMANLPEILLKFRRDHDVYKRRGRKKAKNEFLIYMRGIYKMDGIFTFAYVFPILRFMIRCLPSSAVKALYGSRIRKLFLQKNPRQE